MGVCQRGPALAFTLLLYLPFLCHCLVYYVQPDGLCGSKCDGTLTQPFPTIQQAINNTNQHGNIKANAIMLYPGTYSGPGNNQLSLASTGFITNILGWDPLRTIIDCKFATSAFTNVQYAYVFIQDITITNCVGNLGGGLSGQLSLFLQNTRWINNSADRGGAIYLAGGRVYLTSERNQFINNTAFFSGGAIEATNQSIVAMSSGYFFNGNSARGRPSNIFVADPSESWVFFPHARQPPEPITYPSNSSVVPVVPFPFAFVDWAVNCTTSICTGNHTNPHSSLNQIVNWKGGTILIRPGVYSGPHNTNIDFWSDTNILPWWYHPNSTGDVIIDCEGKYSGISAHQATLNITNVIFRNCHRASGAGGGAIYSDQSLIFLMNATFTNNSAVGYGGAIYSFKSQLQVIGGSFQNNSVIGEGAAVGMDSSVATFLDATSFVGNMAYNANGTQFNDDVSCIQSELQDDGTVSFNDTQSMDCSIELNSGKTAAIFPGSLNGILYPKDASGQRASSFASLNFEYIVELNSTGHPIESTMLVKRDLGPWQLTVTNHTQYITLQYDAFGPSNQVISLIHHYFFAGAPFYPLGSLAPINVSEGVIKTSIQVAGWAFGSKAHYLAIALSANVDNPFSGLTNRTDLAARATEYTFTTSELEVTLSALQYAVYDNLTKVGPVVTTVHSAPSGFIFQFAFLSFTNWMGYDPQFSVLLPSTQSDPTSGGDSALPLRVILALSIGLPGGAVVITMFGILFIIGIIYLIRLYHRHQLNSRVNIVNWGGSASTQKKPKTSYQKMQDEDEEGDDIEMPQFVL